MIDPDSGPVVRRQLVKARETELELATVCTDRRALRVVLARIHMLAFARGREDPEAVLATIEDLARRALGEGG